MTRTGVASDVLRYFEAHRGEDVSGQGLAQRLGVSRNAVWKAVESLRSEGYAVESGTRRGYRFSTRNDILSPEGIAVAWQRVSELATPDVLVFPRIDSTNNEAKRMLASGYAGQALVLAEQQDAGRGRRGKAYASPAGGLYMTLVVQHDQLVVQPTLCTLAAGVAVAHALRLLAGVDAGIKWVNDVYVGGLKVCGILTEAISDVETGGIQGIVVGIGVNVGSFVVPRELTGIAGAVALRDGVSRNEFAAQVIARLLHTIMVAGAGGEGGEAAGVGGSGLMGEYRRLSLVLGREVRYEVSGVTKTGRAVAIEDDGALVVEGAGGQRTMLHGGEVSVRF